MSGIWFRATLAPSCQGCSVSTCGAQAGIARRLRASTCANPPSTAVKPAVFAGRQGEKPVFTRNAILPTGLTRGEINQSRDTVLSICSS